MIKVITYSRSEQILKRRIENIRAAENATQDDCKLLITEAYELIEERREKKKHPLLSWYRNWLLHPRLDRKESNYIIQELDKQFDIPEYMENTSDKVAELLSTKKLRAELKSVFCSINEEVVFLEKFSSWKEFIGTICSILLNKPIFSQKSTKYINCFYLEESKEDKKVIWICEARRQENPDLLIKVWGYFPLNESNTDFPDV